MRGVVALFWVLAFAAIPLWIKTDPPAWDLHVYLNALHAMKAGHDPYADGIAVQEAYHARQMVQPNGDPPPYTYVYSPMTLPLLRAAGMVPGWLSGGAYWLMYVAGVLAMIWAGMQAATEKEQKYLMFFGPAAAFFPGLLVYDAILSGNIVYIFYGLILLTAVVGWRRGQWGWFYAATLAASCCKAPLLSLLPIPILSARRQWLPACVTGAAGLVMFGIQPWLWPTLFRNFMKAVELQFSYNRDFGLSPAGLFGYALVHFGRAYSPASSIFYLIYVVPLFGVLIYLSREYLRGGFSLEQWAPVMLVGVILLNPRVMTYDVAPLSVPMALIVWRSFSAVATGTRALIAPALFFMATNAIIFVFPSMDAWKRTEGVLLVAVFAAGCWNLLRSLRETQTAHG